MGDLFDIANLITTVGVDGIKIKPEPGLPEKSSNEILTELFSTFDADEGIVSSENTDQQVPNASIKAERSEKSQSKKKKSKKKHKHKEKKRKKRSRRNSTDSNSDVACGSIKKKKKHKRKTKRKHERDSSRSTESDEPRIKTSKLDEISDNLKRRIHDKIEAEKRKSDHPNYEESVAIKREAETTNYSTRESASPQLPPISKKLEKNSEEPIIPKFLEKPKSGTHGKILIKDLKNSTVYNETVKEIENKEKAKAAKMEDGEISDSSADNRTPTLSPTPPRRTLSLSPPFDNLNSRTLSPTRVGPNSKNDLRLILREREREKEAI